MNRRKNARVVLELKRSPVGRRIDFRCRNHSCSLYTFVGLRRTAAGVRQCVRLLSEADNFVQRSTECQRETTFELELELYCKHSG